MLSEARKLESRLYPMAPCTWHQCSLQYHGNTAHPVENPCICISIPDLRKARARLTFTSPLTSIIPQVPGSCRQRRRGINSYIAAFPKKNFRPTTPPPKKHTSRNIERHFMGICASRSLGSLLLNHFLCLPHPRSGRSPAKAQLHSL